MPLLSKRENNSNSYLYFKWLIVLLILPAHFINLGLFPLISDEPTRGIVTLEMILSGNYIVPNINGELYLNKPPFFNWIQIFMTYITGSMDEWVFRLPSVLAVFGISILIYLSSRKYLKEYALVAAIAFIVSGRVLFWDSFMGLIDLTYSLVTFGSFLWIISFNRKEKLYSLYIGSYLLAAIGYLMKGIPSVAFQGLTIIAVMLFDKKGRKLFSLSHLAGIATFVLIVGGYYFLFGQYQSVEHAVLNLINESNRLQDHSSSGVNWWLHLLIFPLNFIIEFAPVTLLLLLLLKKEIRQKIFNDRYFKSLIVIFLVNIVIYWLSADMRSRYLFMLVPILIIVLIFGYKQAQEQNSKIIRVINTIFTIASLLISLSLLIYPLWDETKGFSNVLIISILLMLVSLLISLYGIKHPRMRLLALFGCLLVFRIGFNLFNLPARINSYPDLGYKEGEIKAAQISGDAPLYILGDTPINHDASFYITRERKTILTRTQQILHPGTFYIVDDKNLGIFANKSINHEVLHSFVIKLNETKLYLVKRL